MCRNAGKETQGETAGPHGAAPVVEWKLFRFALRHSLLLTVVVALITMFLAYVEPQWVP